MTNTGTPTPAAASLGHVDDRITTRALVARYKRLSLIVAVLVALLVAMFVVDVVGSSAAAVRDSTTCAEWSSASQAKQEAYGVLYQREHGRIPGRPIGAASVVAAVNAGCMQAFANDVEDSVNVAQAIRQ